MEHQDTPLPVDPDHEHGEFDSAGYCNVTPECAYRRPYAEQHPEDMSIKALEPGIGEPTIRVERSGSTYRVERSGSTYRVERSGSTYRVTVTMRLGEVEVNAVESTQQDEPLTYETAIEMRNKAIQRCAESLAWMSA